MTLKNYVHIYFKISTGHRNLISQGSGVPPPTYYLCFGFLTKQFLQRGVGPRKVRPHSFRKVWDVEGLGASLLQSVQGGGNLEIVL